MAFNFLKDLYRNSVIGMEAERAKEEARQRAITRQEEQEARVNQYRQAYLDRIHIECIDKFGEGFSGEIDLGKCSLLYPPKGLDTPKVRTYSDAKKHPTENINLDQKRYEAAAEILKTMPQGVVFHTLKLEKCYHNDRKYDYKIGWITTQEMKYTMQYAVSEEYSSSFFSRICTEHVIHDPKMSEEFIQHATKFAERIWETRKDVISKLLNVMNERVNAMVLYRESTRGLYPPEGHVISATAVTRLKKYERDDEREYLYSTYGLASLNSVQQYGLALCLAKAVREYDSYEEREVYGVKETRQISTHNLRYCLRVSEQGVSFTPKWLPQKEESKPVVEPVLEEW